MEGTLRVLQGALLRLLGAYHSSFPSWDSGWSLPEMNHVHSNEQLTSPAFSSGHFSQCHNHLMALYAHSDTGKPVAVKSRNIRVLEHLITLILSLLQ